MRYTQKYLEENNIKQDYSQEELNEIVSAVAGAAKKIADVTGISGLVKKGAAEFISQLGRPEGETRAAASNPGDPEGRGRRFTGAVADAAAKKITEFPARRRAKKAAADQAAATAARVKEAEEGAESSDLESRFKERRKKK